MDNYFENLEFLLNSSLDILYSLIKDLDILENINEAILNILAIK